MLKKIIFIIFVIIANLNNLHCADESEESEKSIPGETEAEKDYRTSLKEMELKELEKIRNKNIGQSYLEKIQKRYVSRMPYVMLSPMIIPVVKNHSVVGYLTIMPEIKSRNVECYRTIVKDLVFIRDEVFSDLFNALNRLWVGSEPPSADTIAGRIIHVVNTVCKQDVAEKVTMHVLSFNLLINAQKY